VWSVEGNDGRREISGKDGKKMKHVVKVFCGGDEEIVRANLFRNRLSHVSRNSDFGKPYLHCPSVRELIV